MEDSQYIVFVEVMKKKYGTFERRRYRCDQIGAPGDGKRRYGWVKLVRVG